MVIAKTDRGGLGRWGGVGRRSSDRPAQDFYIHEGFDMAYFMRHCYVVQKSVRPKKCLR